VQIKDHVKSIRNSTLYTLLLCSLFIALPSRAQHIPYQGIVFQCEASQLEPIQQEMSAYFKVLKLEETWVNKRPFIGGIAYTLASSENDSNTLTLRGQKKYAITTEKITLNNQHSATNDCKKKTAKKKVKPIDTVSRKEILLALLQRGRITQFSGQDCSVQRLQEHIRVRQQIVAWSQDLNWIWPNGGSAQWNKRYWNKGTPQPNISPFTALRDSFFSQSKYAIGCFTAAKLVMAHAISDYYLQIKSDQATSTRLSERLLQDDEPLVNIEPGAMWYFESDFDSAEQLREGKLLTLIDEVAGDNFVPGDWAYFLNTDTASYAQTGYEGSNAIYLGNGRFADFYNDSNHSYTLKEKIDEVYQWRNGVFNRIRDQKKIRPLTESAYQELLNTPKQGGLLLPYRATPILFSEHTPRSLYQKK
jgi:hypothetical protein